MWGAKWSGCLEAGSSRRSCGRTWRTILCCRAAWRLQRPTPLRRRAAESGSYGEAEKKIALIPRPLLPTDLNQGLGEGEIRIFLRKGFSRAWRVELKIAANERE